MPREGYRPGLSDTHTVAVWFDHVAFDALRAEGRKTVQQWALGDAREWVRTFGEWLYDPDDTFWVFMAENHAAEVGRCLGLDCGYCAEHVLVSNGRGESIFAEWNELRRLGAVVP